MKLRTVEVSEFLSVRKSNPFEIGEITCLVGKNEAGKTAILQGLYRLNPVIPSEGNYDVTDDYPRADVEDYEQDVESGSRTPAIVVKAVFSLDEGEVRGIENEFGTGFLKRPELILSKGYENKVYISIGIDEQIAIEAFIKQAQVPDQLASSLSSSQTIQEWLDY